MWGPFQLALLGLTIVGGPGGRETMPQIRALIPEIAALVCSGDSDDATLSDYLKHGFDAVLAKPHTMERFSAALRLAKHTRRSVAPPPLR